MEIEQIEREMNTARTPRRHVQHALKLLRPYDAQSSGFLMPKIIPKPWGYEEWIVVTKMYAMKRLYVRRGEMLSKHYHLHKTATLTVVSGTCRLLLGAENDLDVTRAKWYSLAEGESVHLNPKTIYTFEAMDDLVLTEVSTPHMLDVVRVQDKYGRA
jgi:mannose-6-phosphate isomerase-like protein (cupin superfamily)